MNYNSPLPPPPNYVMLNPHQGTVHPPSYNRRNIPRYKTHKPRRGCCFRCICCCYCLLFLSIIILAILTAYIFAFYKPRVPSYKVTDFGVAAFDISPDSSINTEFRVTVRADNPNTHIGIWYGKNSSVSVSYKGSVLCRGKLPSFHQGHDNVTMMNLNLKGRSPLDSGLQEALAQNDKDARIPLDVDVRAPMSLVVLNSPMREFTVHIQCKMNVSDLKPDTKPRILSATYRYWLNF